MPFVTVESTPASCLAPNAQRRTHFRVWAPVAADLRRLTAETAKKSAPPTPMEGDVKLVVTVWWGKGRREQDYQGVVHSLKPVVDGLEDAGWFANDRQVKAMEVHQMRDASGKGYVDLWAGPA